MRNLKGLKWTAIGIGILCCVLGACLIIFPRISMQALCVMVGVLAMIAGVFRIVHYISRDSFPFLFRSELTMGIFELVAGLVLVLCPAGILTILPVIVGCYVVVEGAFALQTAIEGIAISTRHGWLLLVLAIASVALGFVLIFSPATGSGLLGVLLGAALLVSGAEQLWMTASATRMLKHFRLEMYDGEGEVR